MANGRCYQGRAVVGVDADEVVVAAARVMAGTSMGPRELLLEVVGAFTSVTRPYRVGRSLAGSCSYCYDETSRFSYIHTK